MKLFAVLREALLGWRDLILLRPTWRDHFALSRAGLTLATAVYLAIVLVLVAVQGLLMPWADWRVLGLGALRSLAPLLALALAVGATGLILRWPAPPLDVLVPGVHGLSLALLLGLLLAALPAGAGAIVLLALLFMMFRLGQEAGRLPAPSAIAFAVLTVLLLVALPICLYILTVRIEPP